MNCWINDNRIKPDTAFLLYFSTMFCLYTKTYIQLAAQIGIIAYASMVMFPNGRIKKSRIKHGMFFVMWYFAFVVIAFASQRWAYSTYAGSKTLITLFRICIIGFVLWLYINTKEKAVSVLLSFIVAISIMGVAAILTTVATGGAVGTTQFGVAIGQHRNQIGAVAAPMVYVCYKLSKEYHMRYGKAFAVFFAALTLCSGSRTSLLQVVLLFAIDVLFEKKASKKFKNIAIGIILGIIVIMISQNIPYLYDTVWIRIENAINTVLGNDTSDSSALGRSLYKGLALIMFKQRPWIGFGVDGFVCYLRDHPSIMGVYMKPVYSHCNYAEIAADFGLLGLLVWYIPVLTTLLAIFKNRNNDGWAKCLFVVFLSFVLSDYSRFPWDTHLVMYMYIIVIALCRLESKEERN